MLFVSVRRGGVAAATPLDGYRNRLADGIDRLAKDMPHHLVLGNDEEVMGFEELDRTDQGVPAPELFQRVHGP